MHYIAAQKNLRLAQEGFSTLDKKYKILALEESKQHTKVLALKNQIAQLQTAAEPLVKHALAYIPLQKLEELVKSPPAIYNIYETTMAVDKAYIALSEINTLTTTLAAETEILSTISAKAKRAKKRSSALENIIIPHWQDTIKNIKNQLEENARDERSRNHLACNNSGLSCR